MGDCAAALGLTQDLKCLSSLISAAFKADAELSSRKMMVKQKDAKSLDKFKAKLKENAGKIGGVFVHYEPESGTWLMKVDHF